MKKVLGLIVLTCASFIIKAQEKLYFPLFEVLNVHEDYQYSAAKLLKSYSDEVGKYELILPTKPEQLRKVFDKATVQAEAKTKGATLFLLADMNAIGETLILSLTIYNTETGVRVWGDRAKANGLSDLDPILMQISKLMGTEKKVSDVVDIYSVSNYDAKNLRKKESDGGFMVSLGGMTTFISDLPNLNNVFSGGFGIGYFVDSRTFMLEFGGELKFGDDVDYRAFYLKGYYPFNDKAISPILGGGFAYAAHTVGIEYTYTDDFNNQTYTNVYDESFGGLVMSVDGGVVFNRTSSTNLILTGSYYISTYKVQTGVAHGFMFGLKAKF